MRFPLRQLTRVAICGLAILATASHAAANDNGRGRHRQLYAVPVPGPVTIDGKFDDWDLSGQIEMFVVQATRGTMNAKFAVMYDAEALYLAADVNDPSPMMNRRSPETDPRQGWNADSCQFRLTTDPKVGYPILDESTFKYKVGHHGKADTPETRDDIVHLTLWRYTDTGEPQLAMQLGMTYREPKNAPRGLVPQDQFQANYLDRADGTGYSFEHRIPWTTLNAKAPLKAGDVVASTVQFNYSRPDGQETAGGAAWAYDLLREPGFPFQSTKCWGKLVFSPTGKVDRKLVLEGVPPDRPLPLEFSYTLPEDSECTIQLFNDKNENVRMLVPQQERLGGRNTERWDGCDDMGNIPGNPHPENTSFRSDMAGWAAISPQLLVWDYTTNFAHYLAPFPNVLALQGNVQFFRDHKVQGVFEQGAGNSRLADFCELKAWLLAKWLWNPDLRAGPWLDEFFTGFYCAAAPIVRWYFDDVHAFHDDPVTKPLGCFDKNLEVIPASFFAAADEQFAAAEQAVADSPPHLKKLRRARVAVVQARLAREPANGPYAAWVSREPERFALPPARRRHSSWAIGVPPSVSGTGRAPS